MERIKRLKFGAKEKESATLLWELSLWVIGKGITQRWYRDADGNYWKTIQEGETEEFGLGGGLLMLPEEMIEELVWFYCAYAPNGDFRGSNETVKWCSKEWDINAVIRDIVRPERVSELETIYWNNLR